MWLGSSGTTSLPMTRSGKSKLLLGDPKFESTAGYQPAVGIVKLFIGGLGIKLLFRRFSSSPGNSIGGFLVICR